MTSPQPNLPERALSVRQPWAWAIIHGGKTVENRSAAAVKHGLDVRSRIAIHAAKTLSQRDYRATADFMASIGVNCPEAAELQRGGIIGSVEVYGCVEQSDSPWFFGPRGLLLRKPIACDFIPCNGLLGYFYWRKNLTEKGAPRARWMMRQAAGEPEIQNAQGSLI